MTSILKVSVQDGVVLAADSRTTTGHSESKFQVFDGVQKVFVLHPDVPVAMVTWGQNRFGGISMERVMADVQSKLSGGVDGSGDWKLDSTNVSLADISLKVANFVYHEHYLKAVKAEEKMLDCTLHFAGFSTGKPFPGHAEFRLSDEHLHGPSESDGGNVQVNFVGAYVARLISAIDPRAAKLLAEGGLENEAISKFAKKMGGLGIRDLLSPAMPLSEVAALVRCIMNAEITLSQFGPEPDTVGGDLQMVVVDAGGCREMRFKPYDFRIPPSVFKNGNVRR
ncbi:MAG: hypothetical protein WAO83_09395 [Fuerstiella sp.]